MPRVAELPTSQNALLARAPLTRFTLLADADKKVAEAFGVMKEKNMYGKKVWGVSRTTFVIGPDGKIQHIFENVKPDGHAEQVLAYLKESGKVPA